ncbi:V-type ATP synthase subunit I, partial [Chlamydiales bacterium SCGC AG-110-M15]
MRIDVRKFLFMGVERDRKLFFERAQELGIIEFIDSRKAFAHGELPKDIQDFQTAIKVLSRLTPTEQDEIDESTFENLDHKATRIIELSHQIENFHEEERILKQEIARVEIFGNFSLDDIAFIEKESKRVVQFFFSKEHAEVEAVNDPNIVFVGNAHGLNYFMAINKERIFPKGMVEMRVERPLGALQQRLIEVKAGIEKAEDELHTLAHLNDLLHAAVIDRFNAYNLDNAQNYVDFVVGDSLFAVEAWVANSDVDAMLRLTDQMNIHADEIAIEENDRVPTHLRNEGLAEIGEDLVHIYDTPSTEDKDPSAWVLWGFAVFFAIILGDGGYGLIFLLLSFFLRFKFPNMEGMGKRMVTLLTILSTSCILWGVLSNSFFGIKFEPDSAFRKFSAVNCLVEKKTAYHMTQKDKVYQEWVERFPTLKSVSDPREFIRKAVSEKDGVLSYDLLDGFSGAIMLELALFIGVVHLSMSLLRGLRGNWPAVGWVLFMIGSYLHFPSILNTSSMIHVFGVDEVSGAENGLQLIYAGIGSAVVLGVIQHKLLG